MRDGVNNDDVDVAHSGSELGCMQLLDDIDGDVDCMRNRGELNCTQLRDDVDGDDVDCVPSIGELSSVL